MGTNEMNNGWAVVTGASSGIGWVFALELARRGHPVLAVARRRERLEALAQQVATHGGHVEPLVADLTVADGLAAVVQRVAALGSIDLLVNNAGIATAGNVLDAALETELRALQLNVEAVVTLTHALLPEMVRRGHGAIINLASVVAFQPFPHFALYAASKAFVLSFTEALAEELKGTGVRVLALCPGAVRSEMDVFSGNEGLLGKLPSLTPEQVVGAALRALARGRVTYVVGWPNRMLVFTNRVLPRRAIRWLMGVAAKPPAGQSSA
jgi:short-subunit dehydrogenase